MAGDCYRAVMGWSLRGRMTTFALAGHQKSMLSSTAWRWIWRLNG